MKILFLSSWFPYPADNGSKIRIYNLLKGLSHLHDITLITFASEVNANRHISFLLQYCNKVEVVPGKKYNPNSYRAVFGFLNPKPRSVVDTYSEAMQERIIEELAMGTGYDLLIASQIAMAVYVRSFHHPPMLLEEIELAGFYDRFINAKSRLLKLRNGLTWFKIKNYVARSSTNFKASTVVSEKEKLIVSSIIPKGSSIYVIPNCVAFQDYQHYENQPEPDTLIFTGSFAYSANYEAVCFFLKEIYPLVKCEIPQVRFTITGQASARQLPPELQDESVVFTGYVPDVKPLIAGSVASVVPILEGGGTRLKILEALALGTPIVSTSKGAEGLEVRNGQHLFIADEPEEFAACVIRLLEDPGLRKRLSHQGRLLVQDKYDWQSVMPRFLEIVDHIAKPA